MESGFVICGGSPGCFPLSVGRLSGEAGAKDTDEERDGRREKNSCRQFRGSREPHLTARKSCYETVIGREKVRTRTP
ncbi:hypothetical protein TNIN_114411 [Trichonephila inaurata madagascariensis]|uniref:Uncharacterized protein n=1 Tax=Trichonephila inaurata madagascariensis TaxID=2747483 RepID=A0A8X6K2B5_9ARAC|nr:hypothetical protein TNIN_114411 [Trichonephila inaurata madagascariensis]